MGKTIEVATDRSFDQSKTVLPTEVARGVYMQNAPSLAALKLMHLMISTAGGRMADDVEHQIRLSDIRNIDGMKNHDRASLTPLFIELSVAVLVNDDPEAMVVTIGGLLDEARINYRNEGSGDLLITWWFGRSFRRMAAESNHWAILDRQTVFHLGSRYSMLLYQHIASFQNYRHITDRTFTVQELRDVLGIPTGKLVRFSHLNDRVIKHAIAEINQLSRLTLTATPHKVGRSVETITIAWQTKDDLKATKRELNASKVGRAERRSDGADEVISVAFPAHGSIEYNAHWTDLKRAAGCNMDNSLLASRFRDWCKERGISLDAANIETVFSNYCAKVGKV